MSRPMNPSCTVGLLLLAALLVGAPALAARESGWYVEGAFAQASLDATFGARWPKWFDDDDDAASLEVGRTLGRYLAVQGGFHDLGDYLGLGSPCPEDVESCIETLERLALAAGGGPDGLQLCAEGRECLLAPSPVESEVRGLSLSLVPRWPVNDRFSVFGKVGWIDWEADMYIRQGVLGRSRIEEFSDQDLLTGLGARYDFPKRFGVLIEHRRLDLDLAVTSLGLRWRF